MNGKTIPKFFGSFPKSTSADKKLKLQSQKMVWQNYARSRRSLMDSKIVPTYRSPESDFSEWLVCTLYDGIKSRKKNERWSDLTSEGKTIEVKSLSSYNGYALKDKDFTNEIATHFVFVVFNDFIPEIIFEVKSIDIKNLSKKKIGISDLMKIGKRVDNGFLKIFSLSNDSIESNKP